MMEHIKRIVSRGGAKNQIGGKEKILDRRPGGEAMQEKDVLTFLKETYESRREERLPLERQWTLNADFYAGYQSCGINPASGELQHYNPEKDYEEQGVYNRIAPLIETRIATLRQLSCAMAVHPRTNEGEDCEKSEIAGAVLRYAQANGDFYTKKDTLLLLSELYGTAFMLSGWDRDGGAPVDGGAPDLDEAGKTDALVDGATPISAALGEGGGVREGELSYEVLTPYEVFPEDLTKPQVEDQGSILLCEVLTEDEVRDLYGKEVKGGDVEIYTLSAVSAGSISGQAGAVLAPAGGRQKNGVRVFTYMEKPNARHAKGLLIVGTEDALFWYSDLPYDEIPLVSFKCKEAAGQFFGRSVICDLIPLQRAYNGIKNKIHDYIRAVAANPLLVPEGAIADIDAFAERGLPPGEVVEYNPECGRPEPLSPAPLPSELRYECEKLASDMEYTAGVSQLMVVGKTPSGVTSGTAIENLRQIDNTRIALTGENLRKSVKRMAVIWLKIYKRFLSGYRTLEIAGTNEAAGVLAFSADDINSYDVAFLVENELILSPEAQKENFLQALNMGLFHDDNGRLPRSVKSRAKRMLRIGSGAENMDCDELQIQAAARENASLLTGEVPKVGLFDDHELHVETHKKFLLQARFSYFKKEKPALASALESHVFEHMLRLQEGKAANDERA